MLTEVPFPLMSAIALPAVGDPSATRTVYATIVVLLVLAVALAVLAVWLFRRTRPDPELFAPLEEMDTRSFRRADPDARSELLDSSRPARAKPVSLTLLASDDALVPEQSGESHDDGIGDTAPADASAESDQVAGEVRADADVPTEIAELADEVDDDDAAEATPDGATSDDDVVEVAGAEIDSGGGDATDDAPVGSVERDDSTRAHGIAWDATPAN